MRRRVWLAGLAMVALVACGGDDDGDEPAAGAPSSSAPASSGPSSSPPPTGEVVNDSSVIVDRLVDAGVCTGARAKSADQLSEGVDNAWVCTTDDATEVTVEGFADQARFEAFLRRGEAEGCPFFAGMDVPYVAGRWWTVSVPIEMGESGEAVVATELYGEVAEASQGEVRAIEC